MSQKGNRQLISLEAPKVTRSPLEYLKRQNSFFYIEGGNGANLVKDYCMNKGWTPIQDKTRNDYMLKWCSIKRRSNYISFQEGKQLIYQIPNNWIFTTKIGLLRCLRDYEIQQSKIWNSKELKMADFYPESYRLDIPSERKTFFSLYKDSQTWICKPTGLNQGRGIFLLQNSTQVNDLQRQMRLHKHDRNHVSEASIVQRYIPNPLLLGGRKFDVRSYMIISSTEPYVVFFRHGYVRLTCEQYDHQSTDLTSHLTNQYMQKKHPSYKELKDETIWSMERFNNYVNQEYASKKHLPRNWVLNTFTKKMQLIMAHCFKSFKSRLTSRRGYFDLIGCDFLIDEDFQVWLLEMNCNPSLSTSCKVQKEVIPGVIKDTLDLTLEIFNKRKGELILPLKTKNQCVLLYNGQMNQVTVKSDWSRSTKVQREPLNVKKLPPIAKAPDTKKRAKQVDLRITSAPAAAMSKVRTEKDSLRLPPILKQKPVRKSSAELPDVRNKRNDSLQTSSAGRLSKIKTSHVLPDIRNMRNSSTGTASVERPSTSECKTPRISKRSCLLTPAPPSAEVKPLRKFQRRH
ncbi:protein polyglycylase TTLL10-like [Spea bombifrons]|uniref:protein polyglycylase TTLL10-like n=1 Tax=Spea bombifrons TaxID=233779 RepID=UPI00234AB079|nr:protein polyglycylase TTLL10-like [Spea bombifrons]